MIAVYVHAMEMNYKEKFKITFITSTLWSGGTERVISLLAHSLSNRGYHVEIICVNKNIVFYKFSERIRIFHIEEEIHSKKLYKKACWFRRYIIKSKPDVVLAFMTSVYCFTLGSLIGTGVPVITSERIDPRWQPVRIKLFRKLFLWLTSHHIVQTEDIKSYYSTSIQKRTTVIYNPVT